MKFLTLLFVLISTLSFSQISVDSIPGEEIINHSAYTLSYNEDCEQANWVFHLLTIDRLENPVIERKGYYRSDDAVSTGSSDYSDYTHSGYDRGHMAPAADMQFDSTAMYESFYMSNMCPQHPSVNRGIWKKLENLCRDYTMEYDSIHVYSGPILYGTMQSIGENNVCVPNYFYKVIYCRINNRYDLIVCYLIPNERPPRGYDLDDYIVSLSKIEEMTGLDFIVE